MNEVGRIEEAWAQVRESSCARGCRVDPCGIPAALARGERITAWHLRRDGTWHCRARQATTYVRHDDGAVIPVLDWRGKRRAELIDDDPDGGAARAELIDDAPDGGAVRARVAVEDELPGAARTVQHQALAAGWTCVAHYAQGASIESVVLRGRHPDGRRFVRAWERSVHPAPWRATGEGVPDAVEVVRRLALLAAGRTCLEHYQRAGVESLVLHGQYSDGHRFVRAWKRRVTLWKATKSGTYIGDHPDEPWRATSPALLDKWL
jgi:hypothetical protein